MKDWLIIIGTILILLILIDGIRRKRNERYGSIKVSRSLKKSLRQAYEGEDADPSPESPNYTSELPNGGARIIGQRDPSVPVPSIEKKARAKSFLEKRSRQPDDSPLAESRSRDSRHTGLNLNESVPMLMESVDNGEDQVSNANERIEPSFSAYRDNELLEEGESTRDENRTYERDQGRHSEQDRYNKDDYDDNHHEDDDSYTDKASWQEDSYEENEPEDDYDEHEDVMAGQAAQSNIAEKQLEPEEVLIINVMAQKGDMFNGAELLDIILKCGMRYGNMDIFHRYSDVKGEGALLFSMANMVKPGTFDLDAMDEFQTPGVSLFMTLPINADSMQSFELMVDTAQAIADGLNGELKDEQRSAMTRQTLEHCRQRIRDFERRRLFRRPPR